MISEFQYLDDLEGRALPRSDPHIVLSMHYADEAVAAKESPFNHRFV